MLSDRVKALRMAHGMSQEQLAKAAKVSQQLIGKIELGKVRESRKLLQIAQAFHLTVEELLAGAIPAHVPGPPLPAEWPFTFSPSLLKDLSPSELADVSGMVEDRVARILRSRGVNRRRRQQFRGHA
jgi:DNA-binding XRE family transcriptional regulator